MDGIKQKPGPVLRLFHVRVKPGGEAELLRNFATTSADVVKDEPGNEGYFFGRGVAGDDGCVVFASIWQDLDAIKQRFGSDWHKSFLPPGYEDLIEECSVQHIDMNSGWHVRLSSS